MTLGGAAAARVRLIVWCKECQHQVEPDPAEMAARYGIETSALDWREPARLFSLRQPAGRYGGASEMRPQPVTAAAYHVPRRPSIAHLSLLRQPRGDLVVPNASQCPTVHSSDP
jgi:hypothetical protein